MRYVLLIQIDEKGMEGKSPEEMAPVLDAWHKYTDDLQKSGKLLAGEALQPTATATTVRVQRDKTITTDGPYAEVKEQLGGGLHDRGRKSGPSHRVGCQDAPHGRGWGGGSTPRHGIPGPLESKGSRPRAAGSELRDDKFLYA